MTLAHEYDPLINQTNHPKHINIKYEHKKSINDELSTYRVLKGFWNDQ